MKTDVRVVATQVFLSRHVRASDDATSCLPRWLAQMIASPAYSSSVICPYNTYTHSRTYTHTHTQFFVLGSIILWKEAFHVEMSAFTPAALFFLAVQK